MSHEVSNFGNDFEDVSRVAFSFIKVSKRRGGAREAKPESSKNELLSVLMLQYGQLRNKVLKHMKDRGTDLFWIQWMEDIMPISPSAPKMWALLHKSRLIAHADTEVQIEIESIVIDYFKVCTSIDIRSFLDLENPPCPNRKHHASLKGRQNLFCRSFDPVLAEPFRPNTFNRRISCS